MLCRSECVPSESKIAATKLKVIQCVYVLFLSYLFTSSIDRENFHVKSQRLALAICTRNILLYCMREMRANDVHIINIYIYENRSNSFDWKRPFAWFDRCVWHDSRRRWKEIYGSGRHSIEILDVYICIYCMNETEFKTLSNLYKMHYVSIFKWFLDMRRANYTIMNSFQW